MARKKVPRLESSQRKGMDSSAAKDRGIDLAGAGDSLSVIINRRSSIREKAGFYGNAGGISSRVWTAMLELNTDLEYDARVDHL